MYAADCRTGSMGRTGSSFRKREMAIRQLTSCFMASCLLLSTSASAAAVRSASPIAGAEPPQIKAQYSSTLVVQVGATVRISCPVHADPRPLVTWTKDSERLHAGWQRFRVQRAGTWLHVSDVQTTDAGRYTCEATNGFGTATVTINLRVVPDTNNASLYDMDDVSSGEQVTSQMMTTTTSGMTSQSADDHMTTVLAPTTDNDILMASLLCVGAAVCVVSLGVLLVLAARRRLRSAPGDKRVVVPVSAARSLLAVAAAARPTSTVRRDSSYHAAQPTGTLCNDNWTTSHVTSILITGHQHDLWAASADTCYV